MRTLFGYGDWQERVIAKRCKPTVIGSLTLKSKKAMRNEIIAR